MNKLTPDATARFLRTAFDACEAARTLLHGFFRSKLDVKTKGVHYNLVTQADIECEHKIVEVIRASFPDHNILAEEHAYGKTASPYAWVVDPLDGTNNFAHRLPHYSVSIALACEGETLVGTVLDPERNELFHAVKGGGAFLNGKAIKPTGAATIPESLFITGFYYDRGEKMSAALRNVETLLKLGAIDIRRFGSAALDLCYVADGRADGYFEFQLNPWDFAAGALILEEAGGRVTDYRGERLGLTQNSIAATNGLVHEALLGVLK